MKIRIFQKGFNYSQDGPGNRLIYHLCGCNMCCPWCANPEGLVTEGVEVDIEEIIAEVVRSRSMFFDGGGVTFTGGEPLMQFEGLAFIVKTLHDKGIDTAVETNASHVRLPELFGEIDHLIMDFKHPFAEQHRKITGLDQKIVLENIQRACEEHGDVLIHIPMVNGYNASLEEMNAFGVLLSKLPQKNLRVEPLWYHEYGKNKWDQLQMSYRVENGFVSEKQRQKFLNILQAYGLKVVRT